MLNFIVCEDDEFFEKKLEEQIDNFMMNDDFNYKIHSFRSYDENFEKAAREDMGFKCYFLDIKTEGGSGLDAIRFIREELDDWVSLIVIISAFSEYRLEILTNRLFILDFVNKLDNCHKKIQEDLNIILKNYWKKNRSLVYKYNYVLNKIDYQNIFYIEKETDSKRCTIHTNYGDFKITKSISDLEKMLGDSFLKIYRSILLNLDQIHSFDEKENVILLKNGEKIDSISREKKKILKERLKERILS